jgi:predicted secreted Zn-dependent protease
MVARNGELVVIGNTANPAGPVTEFTADEWRHFVAGVKQGDFDGIA